MAPTQASQQQGSQRQQTSLLSFFKRSPVDASTTPSKTAAEPVTTTQHPATLLTPPPTATKTPSPALAPVPTASLMEGDDDDGSNGSGVPLSAGKKLRRRILDSDDDDDDEEDAVNDNAATTTKKKKAKLDSDYEHEDDDDTMDFAIASMDIEKYETPTKAAATPTQSKLAKYSNGGGDPSSDPMVIDGSSPSVYSPPSSSSRFSSPGSSSSSSKARSTQQPLKRGRLFDDSIKEAAAAAEEDRYAFLKDIRDDQGRRPGDANYDNRTLYIPPSVAAKFKPFEKQYWDIKCKHFDTVVFFKKGFFYELYEVDADIGVREFELNYSRSARAGEMRLAGFPCSKIEEWAAKVIAKGYKVARVDELENSVKKNMREKTGGTKDKIIQRKLTSILTSGTLVYSSVLTDDMATYCVSIKEHTSTEGGAMSRSFGVVVLEAATANFSFALLEDDTERTQLETLLMQLRPTELVCERGNLSPETLRLIKNVAKPPITNVLQKGTEFWDADTTDNELRRHDDYLVKEQVDGEEEDDKSTKQSFFDFAPADVVKDVSKNPVLMSAFGGLLWYLRSLKLDAEMLTQQRFQVFQPIAHGDTLILDGQTLINLDVLRNSTTGGSEGTLLQLLSHCVTPMGKRLFQRWLCHPLRHVPSINMRLDAVQDMLANVALWGSIKNKLRSLPDLERILSRIRADNCKINDFLQALDGFALVQEMRDDLVAAVDSGNVKASRLVWLLERLPDCAQQLKTFKKSFDIKTAKAEGVIIPVPGADPAFDKADKVLEEIIARRDKHIDEQKKLLGFKEIACKDVGGDCFLLEIAKDKKVPSTFISMGSTSKVSRYHTQFLKSLAVEYAEAQETRSEVLRSVSTRIYAQFAHHEELWARAINVMSEIDCLLSLAESSQMLGEHGCRPEIVDKQDGAFLDAVELRHPTIKVAQFVPNDIALGGEGGAPTSILLTGPNMGGKSTLLRQTCIAIIMAQLGCFVPAKSCKMAPFDRIFTRIGAHDNILAGHSTFMVELQETSRILRSATPKSLVILDELGRGTSTFDGYAIAYAVLSHIVSRQRALTLFATHYHGLTEEFQHNSLVALKHMACVVQDEQREVVFLYKLTPGSSTKSFGMHVASMAGVPSHVVDVAEKHAHEFEKTYQLKEAAALSSSKLSLARKADVSCMVHDGTSAAVIRNIWRSLTSQ